jgi:hypothetical protein
MQKTLCDRCDKEIKRSKNGTILRYVLSMKVERESTGGNLEQTGRFRVEVCEKCAAILRRGINFIMDGAS